MFAEGSGRPLIDRCTVEPDLAPHGLPNADQQPCQRGFARGTGTDDAETIAAVKCKAYILHDEPCIARGTDADRLDRKRLYWPRQLHRRPSLWQFGQEFGEASSCLARRDKSLPIGNGEFNWSKRPRDEDGARNDHAGRRLLIDDKISAKAEH